MRHQYQPNAPNATASPPAVVPQREDPTARSWLPPVEKRMPNMLQVKT